MEPGEVIITREVTIPRVRAEATLADMMANRERSALNAMVEEEGETTEEEETGGNEDWQYDFRGSLMRGFRTLNRELEPFQGRTEARETLMAAAGENSTMENRDYVRSSEAVFEQMHRHIMQVPFCACHISCKRLAKCQIVMV